MSGIANPSRPAPRGIHLGVSGLSARIDRDGFSEDGWVLELGGMEQSHVDLADQSVIRHEYLRRMAHVADTLRPAGEPIRVVHLGAGALTLPRYLALTRPGSAQTVVEIERELPGFVLDTLPCPEGTRLEVVIGDARAQLAFLDGPPADLVVLDVFTGEDAPDHLACPEFYDECLAALAPEGALLVNIGDDAGLRFFARQAQSLEEAARDAGLGGAWTLTDSRLLDLTSAGNLVVAIGDGVPGEDPEGRRSRWLAAGPHPAAVLDPHETAELTARILQR